MRKIISMVGILLLVAGLAVAHPGRTDGRGGHKHKASGTYHCHTCSSKSSSTSARRVKVPTIIHDNIPIDLYGKWTVSTEYFDIVWDIEYDKVVGYRVDSNNVKTRIVNCYVDSCAYRITKSRATVYPDVFVVITGDKKFEFLYKDRHLTKKAVYKESGSIKEYTLTRE